MRTNARGVQHEACAAEWTADEPGSLLQLDFTAALRARNLHDAGGAMASPQLGQNFVPGGTGVLQWVQVMATLRFAPQEGQNLAKAVTFSPQRGHLLATTIWCPQAGQNRAVSGTSP